MAGLPTSVDIYVPRRVITRDDNEVRILPNNAGHLESEPGLRRPSDQH